MFTNAPSAKFSMFHFISYLFLWTIKNAQCFLRKKKERKNHLVCLYSFISFSLKWCVFAPHEFSWHFFSSLKRTCVLCELCIINVSRTRSEWYSVQRDIRSKCNLLCKCKSHFFLFCCGVVIFVTGEFTKSIPLPAIRQTYTHLIAKWAGLCILCMCILKMQRKKRKIKIVWNTQLSKGILI